MNKNPKTNSASISGLPILTVDKIDGNNVEAQIKKDGASTVINFPQGLDITVGQALRVQHV